MTTTLASVLKKMDKGGDVEMTCPANTNVVVLL